MTFALQSMTRTAAKDYYTRLAVTEYLIPGNTSPAFSVLCIPNGDMPHVKPGVMDALRTMKFQLDKKTGCIFRVFQDKASMGKVIKRISRALKHVKVTTEKAVYQPAMTRAAMAHGACTTVASPTDA